MTGSRFLSACKIINLLSVCKELMTERCRKERFVLAIVLLSLIAVVMLVLKETRLASMMGEAGGAVHVDFS